MISSLAPPDFPREKLGLCMIVKNESRALGRCLQSAKDWVGEMVVVDTGSTDETVAIALAAGARVSHFPWCDDFSAARNAALDLATREWVLVLDADETFAVESAKDFARALQQSRWDGFSLPIHSLNDDGTQSKAMVFRLFRRARPGMRYRGEIHEQLEAVAARQVSTSVLESVQLAHDGYTAAVVSSGDKVNRNIRLSRKLTQSRPDDAFSWFVYAMAIAQSDPDGMLQAAQTAFELIEAYPARAQGEHYVVHLFLAVINVHRSRGQETQALRLADKALVMFPDSPDLRYQRGGARIAIGDAPGAVADFQAALSPAALAFNLLVDPAAAGYGARTGFGRALRQLARDDEAIEQLRMAVAQAPVDYASAHLELGALLMDRGALGDAVPFFDEALRRSPSEVGVAFKLGWCLYKLKHFDKAEAVLRGQMGEAQAELLLARVLLDTARAEQALPLLVANALPAALLTLGWSHFVLGQPEAADSVWDAWLAQASHPSTAKTALLLIRELMQDASPAMPELLSASEPSQDMDAWVLLLLRYRKTTSLDQIIRSGPRLGPGVWSRLRMRWAQNMVVEGFVDAGTALLLEAAREAPDEGAIYYWLGYCAVLRQQVDDARVLFEECLRLEPSHAQARQAIALLN